MPTLPAHLAALEAELEAVVVRHLEAYEASAQEAVARAFRAATVGRSTAAHARRTRRPQSKARRASAPKRSAEKLAALVTQLESLVVAEPGRTMRELSIELGVAATALAVPMRQLKRMGRVRRVGSRQFTRYYPQAMSPSRPTQPEPADAAPNNDGDARSSMNAL